MADKDPLDIVLEAAADAKAKDIESIGIDNLIAFIQDLRNKGYISPIVMKKYEAEWQAWSGKETARYSEMIKAVILTGQAALKSAILINGGATVAVLSLLGSLLIKTPEGRAIPSAELALCAFAFTLGVLFSSIASGTTYLSTFCFVELTGKSWARKVGIVINGLTWSLVIGSYIAFLCGAIRMYLVFRML